jgi:hypothetical protein
MALIGLDWQPITTFDDPLQLLTTQWRRHVTYSTTRLTTPQFLLGTAFLLSVSMQKSRLQDNRPLYTRQSSIKWPYAPSASSHSFTSNNCINPSQLPLLWQHPIHRDADGAAADRIAPNIPQPRLCPTPPPPDPTVDPVDGSSLRPNHRCLRHSLHSPLP